MSSKTHLDQFLSKADQRESSVLLYGVDEGTGDWLSFTVDPHSLSNSMHMLFIQIHL